MLEIGNHSLKSSHEPDVDHIRVCDRSEMTVGGFAWKGAGMIKKPAIRIQATDVQTAALWGAAAGATAIWIVQPFDWVKKTFLEKPEPEE